MQKTQELIPFMNTLSKEIDKIDALNKLLKPLDIEKSINYKETKNIIEQQIKSAKNPFTIAFVGEYKSGKSTIINSILGLTGKEALSSEESPDTAKAIRLMYKTPDAKDEAQIIYQDDCYAPEWMCWEEAKKFTSQVATDNITDQEFKKKQAKIDEVRYYIDNLFLNTFNILDLPGTGAGGHILDHQAVTEEKIQEVEVIFWVVTTYNEPSSAAIENLSKFRNKIYPLINVWQYKEDDIYGEIEVDEMLDFISEHYSIYFSDNKKPIVYYAREIQAAQENGDELEPEWGKESLSSLLIEIQNAKVESKERDRTNRIKKALTDSLEKLKPQIKDINKLLDKLQTESEKETSEIDIKIKQLAQIKKTVESKTKDESITKADEIIQYINSITDSFIEDQMQSGNLKLFFKAIGKKNKQKLETELSEKFTNEYLDLSKDSKWFNALMNEFISNIKDLLIGDYIIFALNKDNLEITDKLSTDSFIDTKFITSIIESSMNAVISNLIPMIGVAIMGVILILVPGGEIIDNLAVAVMGGGSLAKMKSPLEANKENIKMRTKAKILMQKYTIKQSLMNVANDLNNSCYEKILQNINDRTETNKNNIKELVNCTAGIKSLNTNIEEWIEDIQNI